MRGSGRIRGFILGLGLAAASFHQYAPLHSPLSIPSSQAAPDQAEVYIETYATGYNTVRAQTDDPPCIAASCDKDMRCPYNVAGRALVKVPVVEQQQPRF